VRALLTTALVLLVPGLAAGAEMEIDAEALARGQALLVPYATKQQLSNYLDKDPFLCAGIGAGREICTWRLGNRDPAWSALTGSVPTEDRINVVCELSTPDGALAPQDCSIHPRRSNRYAWKPNRGSTKQRMNRQAVSHREMRERQQRAEAIVAAARTPLELSRVVGQGPTRCVGAGTGQWRCTWNATAQTWGQGTLMMVLDTSVHDKITMTCVLPESGPRDADACDISVEP
jgi:hypothetical protein